jgi:hypothetical protein
MESIVFKYLAMLGLAGLLPALPAQGYASLPIPLPENPIAFEKCTAVVKVDAARLRSGPSLESKILGVRLQDSPLYVSKVYGKWVQVVMASGDTAYMAAYLLTFPANEILEQYKRANPSPSLGKKAKVKWAKVNYRQYPSAKSAYLGHFQRNEEVAILNDLGNGWSLVESEDPHGKGTIFGFITNRALAPPDLPDSPYWSTPLAKAHGAPPKAVEPAVESLGQYCSRTAWTPELFAMEMKTKSHRHFDPGAALGETLVATR